MSNLKSLVVSALFFFSAVTLVGCGSAPSDQAENTAAISIGAKCGTKTCSKYQACCDGARGPYCTTTACEEANEDSVVVGVKCGKTSCSREESCCDGPRGEHCTTTACTEDELKIGGPVGGVCGDKVCSRYQSCCDRATGPYCTTTACVAD